MKEMALYIHIPFCVRKCQYCDFLSAPATETIRQAYVDKLLAEIRAAGALYSGYQISSVFIGGGTPSILFAEQMQCILNQLKSSFYIQPDAEITIECNPGTVDVRKLQAYWESGVNRLSIGLQSADAQELQLLGRIHTYEQFVENYEAARKIGFLNINVDLIFAIPGQKIGTYEKTLKRIISLKPQHISAYSLIIEEGTPFFKTYGQADLLRQKGKEQQLLPTEEEEIEMYTLTKELLECAGYHRYEISNYALDGFCCQHNAGYWLRKNYLGIGLGASSFIENVRFTNIGDLGQYLQLDFANPYCAVSDREELDVSAQMEEFMFLGLRMMNGVSAEKFKEQFSKTIEEVYGEVFDRQLKQNLITKTNTGYCLTDYGITVSNFVMSEYLLN